MAASTLSSEERVGLIVAVALHAAVIAALLLPARAAPPPRLPDRMAVTLSDDVGLVDTAPAPAARPAPDVAPALGEARPDEQAPAPRPSPLPPEPAPARAAPSPAPSVQPSRPAPAPAPPATGERRAPKSRTPAGADRIGKDFLKGLAGADAGDAHSPPASAIGPAVRASLQSAISRQLKPNWQSPSGVEVEKLATTVEWNLNSDGSLDGPPRFVAQTGVSSANQAQAQRHREQAIRAVRVSAPFTLPRQYYSAWRRLRFTFDWKLDQ